MIQAHVFISGFVQGVGYRYFVKKSAQSFGIKGWVRNLPDGRVETVLQAEKGKILELIEKLYSGPLLSEVENVLVDWEEVEEKYSEFVIDKSKR